MMKKTLLVVAMVLLALGITFAQRTVSGSVTDQDGGPLIGASVLVKGTTSGTITDFDGRYTLSIPEGRDVLVFSFTGFDPQEITLGASNVVNIVLSEGVTLQTAVVTALGIEKEEKTLGYGVTQVDGDDVTRTRNNSFVDALSGKVSGLTVNTNSQPGGSSEIVIRGYGSVTGNNQALVVIDGVPASNGNNTSITTLLNPLDDFNRSQDFGNQVNDINPDDIESISVLKGAAATALYGSRAANGAIIITTKSGKRNQKLTVDYSGSYSQSQVNRLPHMQNTFGQGWNGLFDPIENGSWGPKTDDQLRLWGNTVDNSRQLKPFSALENNLRDFYENGYGVNNSVSVSGGNESASFRLSYSNSREDGVVPTDADSYIRNTVGLKGELGDEKFSVGASVEFMNKEQKAIATGQGDDAGAGKVLFQELIQFPRDISIIDHSDYESKFNNLDNFYTPYAQNPYFVLNNQGNEYSENRVRGNVNANYNFTEKLTASLRIGGDFSNGSIFDYGNVARITPGSPNSSSNDVVGRVSENNLSRRQLNGDLLLTYNTSIGSSLSLDVTLGSNVNERFTKYVATYVTDLTIPGFYQLSNSTVNPTSASGITLQRLFGVYSIVNLGYNDWLYATLQARNDWSSTLPKENNSFFYPAFTVSAILSDAFSLPSQTISFLKVRASVAQVGNDAPPYRITPIYTAAQAASGGFGSIVFPIGGTNAFELGDRIGNDQLQPEITTEYEVGADVRLFRNRLGFDVAYYNRVTTDQIINVEKDPTSGFTSQTVNIGEIQNKGIELMVNATPVKKSKFRWDINYNFNKNNNEVLALNQDAASGNSIVLNTAYGIELRAEVGQPLGTIYAPSAQLDPDGNIVVNPANGLPQQADDKKLMGTVNPDFQMGLGNTLSYGDFALSFDVDYRKGGVFWSYTARLNYFVGNAWNTQYNDREPYIIPNSVVENADGTFSENTTEIDRSNIFTYWGGSSVPAREENHVLDKTFFKLRNVSLTYNLPTKLTDRLNMNRASLTVFGRNLVLWTPEENHFVDPEGSTFGVGLAGKIGEFSNSPTNAVYGVTLKLSL